MAETCQTCGADGREPTHCWDARQVIEAKAMLVAAYEGTLDPEIAGAWLEQNHPGPRAHATALQQMVRDG